MKDKKLKQLITHEVKRQQETIDLIASENIASENILNILGSPLTNKYSEGYPGKRYYPGCEYYDEIEKLAQTRALRAFRLDPQKWAVNVQPYSGSPANLAIYAALMEPGDKLMGLSLASGGHLSHGHKVSVTGKLYKAVQYDINPRTRLIDYRKLTQLAKQHKPKIIVSGASAYPRKIDFKTIGAIAKSGGAYHMADISHIAGLVAAQVHPSPFPHADIVMTTTHKTLRGPRGAVIFAKTNLIDAINKAVFPGMQGGPHNNTTAAIAATFQEASGAAFKNYQKQVVKNARVLTRELLHNTISIITGGTDNHLFLVNLLKSRKAPKDGFEAEQKLARAGIYVTRSAQPGDASPFRPTALRLGTPAVTTRGMKEPEMKVIARWITRILNENEPSETIKKEVNALCRKFPAHR